MKRCLISLYLLLPLLSMKTQAYSDKQDDIKTCYGTSDGLSKSQDKLSKLKNYTNCTHVLGNLEITHLKNGDGTYFKNIVEVTGYLIIYMSSTHSIDLSSLRVIRGQTLFKTNYSLFINTLKPGFQLRMTNLTEIQNGRIYIAGGGPDNHDMCFLKTLNWIDIRRYDDNPVYYGYGMECEEQRYRRCDEGCEDGAGCWGSGKNFCQKLSYVTCHEKCRSFGLRCRGPKENDCCNEECASGCDGNTNRECYACKNIFYKGECKQTCPATATNIQDNDHRAKASTMFELGIQCVSSCPEHMLIQEGKCVTSCEINVFEDNDNGRCLHCKPKCRPVCGGVGSPEGKLSGAETVNASNIHVLEGCSEINGNLIFLHHVFNNETGITVEMLRKTFKDLRVITGFLKILSWPKNATSFDAFENLEEIKGHTLEGSKYALRIQDGFGFKMSQISALGLRSLRRIKYGSVALWNMPNLCHWHLDWKSIFSGFKQNQTVNNNQKLFRQRRGYKCFNQSCSEGCQYCAGPTEEMCTRCNYYNYDNRCYDTCPKHQAVYNNPKNSTCLACHPLCAECDGPGVGNCSLCKHYNNTEENKCVQVCPFHLYGNETSKTCESCNPKCKAKANEETCLGPSASYSGPYSFDGCRRCYTARQVSEQEFECEIRNYTCPDGYYSEKPEKSSLLGAKICKLCPDGCKNCTSAKDCTEKYPSYLGVVVAVVTFLCVLVLVLIVYSCWRKRKASTDNASAVLYPWSDPNAPLVPINNQSGLAPNQAQLKIVKETELRIGNLLGSGAFGAVHKGYWIPDDVPNNKRVKIPVAIKILKNGPDCGTDSELLKEALFMASCEHANLVRLLGISVCSRLLLISQLMPLGNLLNYVRTNKEKIGSQYLLNWCLQISQGMQYLSEEKHLVHRDLAARNVLVKSPHHVRITDFGLAKLLDVNEDAYRAQGGKMPIKWLALESIQKQLFTQKSDVWSFGVTMWELMTFGKKPYENTPACQIHSLLQRGERLPQPQICTIDVYMILIRCWMVDVSARPTFRELSEELTAMAQEPQRFIVIPEFKDSYSRLPSQSNSEFLRSLLDEEKDGIEIADAEEYLLPQLNSNYMTFPDGNFLLKRGPTQSWEPCAFFNRSNEENVQLHIPDRRLGSVTTETLPSVSSSYPVSQINCIEQNRSSRNDSIQFKHVHPKPPKTDAIEIKKNQVWFSAQQLSIEKEEATSEGAVMMDARPRANTITIADILWDEKASGKSSTSCHRRMSREREGSVCSARYSADPTQIAANQSMSVQQEYFDLSLPPAASMTVDGRCRDHHHHPAAPPPQAPPHFRALSNPIYQQHAPCLPPNDRRPRTTAPSNGYDIPRVCVTTTTATTDVSGYQNIKSTPSSTNNSSKFQLSKSRLHSSVSENRDSGVQTDDEDDIDTGRCSLTGNLKKQSMQAVNNPSYTMLPSCDDDEEERDGLAETFSSRSSETNKLLSKSSSVNFPIVSS